MEPRYELSLHIAGQDGHALVQYQEGATALVPVTVRGVEKAEKGYRDGRTRVRVTAMTRSGHEVTCEEFTEEVAWPSLAGHPMIIAALARPPAVATNYQQEAANRAARIAQRRADALAGPWAAWVGDGKACAPPTSTPPIGGDPPPPEGGVWLVSPARARGQARWSLIRGWIVAPNDDPLPWAETEGEGVEWDGEQR